MLKRFGYMRSTVMTDLTSPGMSSQTYIKPPVLILKWWNNMGGKQFLSPPFSHIQIYKYIYLYKYMGWRRGRNYPPPPTLFHKFRTSRRTFFLVWANKTLLVHSFFWQKFIYFFIIFRYLTTECGNCFTLSDNSFAYYYIWESKPLPGLSPS